jgi:hypothetical protein
MPLRFINSITENNFPIPNFLTKCKPKAHSLVPKKRKVVGAPRWN